MKKTDSAKPNPTNTLKVTKPCDKNNEQAIADVAYDPVARALVGARQFIASTLGAQGIDESFLALNAQVKDVQTGNLASMEKTLVAQANTLDAIFNEMARRASVNMDEHLHATDTYLRMALKAQAQCRATIETLAELKYPKAATFVRQQNVAYQQQVNNSDVTNSPAHGKTTKPSNKLLTESSNATLDTTGAGAAIGAHPELEAVGGGNRPTNKRRKAAQ